MMPRRRTPLLLLVLAVLAGFGLGTTVEAAPRTTTAATPREQAAAKKKQQAATAKKKQAATAKKKQAAAAKKRKVAARKRKAAAAKRLAARRRAQAKSGRRTNMPRGWDWPPSPAMIDAGTACTDELTALGVVWQPAPAVPKIATPVTVPGLVFGGVQFVSTYRRGPHVMDCHLALALATHGMQLHAQGLRELHFSRIYELSPVRVMGRTGKTLSRHGLGLAIDIRALVDDTGHKALIVDDYKTGDALLLRFEDYLNDCGGFRTVLTPKNDPASHYDHFHVEAVIDYDLPVTRGPGA